MPASGLGIGFGVFHLIWLPLRPVCDCFLVFHRVGASFLFSFSVWVVSQWCL